MRGGEGLDQSRLKRGERRAQRAQTRRVFIVYLDVHGESERLGEHIRFELEIGKLQKHAGGGRWRRGRGGRFRDGQRHWRAHGGCRVLAVVRGAMHARQDTLR